MKNPLSLMHEQELEKARGRIVFYEGIWIWNDAPPAEIVKQHHEGKTNLIYHYLDARTGGGAGDFTFYKYHHKSGRFFYIAKGPGVLCPHPKFSSEQHVPYHGGHWILSKICRRCEHYRKTGRKVRYPTCAFVAAQNPERQPKKY